jgi:predicted nucleic acid-binding protein
MIVADTSTWINFYKGKKLREVELLEEALQANILFMSPPVLAELLASKTLHKEDKQNLIRLPRLEILNEFWERVGFLRGALLEKGLKARTMDCLIAQSCLDYKAKLISNDEDFRHFSKVGLKLA